MTTPVRVPGKYGRRIPKGAPALNLGPLLTGVVPDHPMAEDYLAALHGGWNMLGNDTAGDCVAVTWANVRRLVTSTLTANGYYPSQAEVWTVYKTQNPGFDPAGSADTNGPGSPADGGMDIQALLEYLAAAGGPDGVKAVAFAKVDHANPDEVKAALAIFGYVWTGVNVLAVNMDQFRAGHPWDYDPASPVDGGHSVITGGYGSPGGGPLGGDERFITWAQETSFTDAFWAQETQEAWVVIWPEYFGSRVFLEGVSQSQLAADYQELTGKPLPVPAPPPAPVPPAPPAPAPPVPVPPVPVPPPPPKPGPATLLSELVQMIRTDARNVENWLTAHGLLGDVMSKLSVYSKAFTAVIGQALTYATLYYGGNKYVAAAVAVAAALGVYAVPNQQPPSKSGPAGS